MLKVCDIDSYERYGANNMKKETLDVYNYIKKLCDIEISPTLGKFILHPDKLNGLNKVHLKSIVEEFAPIYQKIQYYLDGPIEMQKISIFEIFLMCRIINKPDLEKLLGSETNG